MVSIPVFRLHRLGSCRKTTGGQLVNFPLPGAPESGPPELWTLSSLIINIGLWLHIPLGKERVVGLLPILSFFKAQSYLVMTHK